MDKISIERIKASMQNTLDIESRSIVSLIENIDYSIAEVLITKISSCKGKIITSGCGTSGAAAKKIAHTLSCIKCPAFFLSPAEALHGGLGVATSNDVVILISKGGQTVELNMMLQQLTSMKVFIVVVAENPESDMAKSCDLFVRIKTDVEPDSFNMLATASTVSVIAYFDAIAIAIKENSNFTKEDFLEIHPGGAVGMRLLHDVQR